MTATNSVSRGTLSRQLHNLSDWWTEEMRSIFPKLATDQGKSGIVSIVMEVDGDSVTTNLIDAGHERLLPPTTLVGLANSSVSQELGALDSGSSSVGLILPDSDVIQTSLTFPKATQENLRSVIGFEMDRHTPFDADSVYFDFEVNRKDSTTIYLDLVVVPRSVVDRYLEILGAAGIEVDRIATKATRASRPMNLLPTSMRRKSGRTGAASFRPKWRAVAALVAIAYCLPAASLLLIESKLESSLDAQRTESADLVAGRQQLIDMLGPAEFFANVRESTPRSVSVLDQLSRLLPDETWVSSLQIEDSTVQFDGESSNAAELISILDQSSFFVDGKFASPITRNPSSGKDRYSIEVRLGGAALSE